MSSVRSRLWVFVFASVLYGSPAGAAELVRVEAGTASVVFHPPAACETFWYAVSL